MLRVAGLRAELEQQLVSLRRRAVQLRHARRDLVARQDNERQRLERSIHDGAQQEVIAGRRASPRSAPHPPHAGAGDRSPRPGQ
jgi:signal transduction histidine kinase